MALCAVHVNAIDTEKVLFTLLRRNTDVSPLANTHYGVQYVYISFIMCMRILV